MEVSTFTEKLNRLEGNIYVVEEEAAIVNGVYEAELQHDNIDENTLSVYTGPKLTGDRIKDYTLSTPSRTPWKRIIRIYTDVPTVYISYETTGDTVESEDINLIQAELVRTQTAVAEEVSRASLEETELRNLFETNKPCWDDKYTKNEVDNKFAALENSIDWKEAVETYDDLVATYPEAEDGWTVNVKDTDYTYRWNGTEWVTISANSIPKATQEVDGLLTHEDKTEYDDAKNKKHQHSNKDVLDGLTQEYLEKLNTIEEGAKVNVQPDWNVTDQSADSFIRNKPKSFPASGGNADTVNQHTVAADVPEDAKFTDTTYNVFREATEDTDGENGLVPAPIYGDEKKFLRADGTWQDPPDGDFVPKGATWNDIMGV